MRQAVIVQQTKQVASDVVQTAAEKTAQGKEAVAQLLQKVLHESNHANMYQNSCTQVLNFVHI